MGTDQVASGEDLVQLIAAHHMAEQHHPGQQAKPASPGHHQRHVGTASSVGAVVPVTDQQEREQAGQFPEKHHLDQVAGDHQPEHGAHECQEKREEARHRIIRRHVVASIQRHQRADAQHQQRKQPGEPVQAQYEIQAQAGQPGVVLADHAAVGDLRVQQGHLNRAGQGDEAGQQ